MRFDVAVNMGVRSTEPDDDGSVKLDDDDDDDDHDAKVDPTSDEAIIRETQAHASAASRRPGLRGAKKGPAVAAPRSKRGRDADEDDEVAVKPAAARSTAAQQLVEGLDEMFADLQSDSSDDDRTARGRGAASRGPARAAAAAPSKRTVSPAVKTALSTKLEELRRTLDMSHRPSDDLSAHDDEDVDVDDDADDTAAAAAVHASKSVPAHAHESNHDDDDIELTFIIIKDKNGGAEFRRRWAMTRPFNDLMSEYASYRGIPLERVKLDFDGDVIQASETPADYDMEPLDMNADNDDECAQVLFAR